MHTKLLNLDLAQIFADVMDIDEATLTVNTNPETVPEWDSLSNVRLVLALERKFEVQFSNDQIAGWKTLRDIQSSLES